MTKINPFWRLWEMVREDKEDIWSIYFYAILSGLVELSVPVGVQAIIGFVLGATMVTSIYILIGLVVLGVAFVGIFQINQMKIIERVQQQIFTRYALDFTEKIPRLDLKKIDSIYLPELVNRFFDTLNVQKGLSKILLDVPIASIQILFGLLLLSFYHPIFIAFGGLLLVILWTILKLSSKPGLATSFEESANKYKVVAWLEEIARVIKSFKFSQGSHFNLQKTDKNVVAYLTSRTSHFRVLLFQYQTLIVFKVLITAAMLVVGTYLLLNQQLNIGEFIAAEIVILSVIGAVEKLISSLDSVYDVITGLEKLAYVLEKPLEKDGSLPLETNDKAIAIEMLDFSFTYSDGNQPLKNLNLHIPAGSTVCISGKAGAGKSTLLKALTGNYSDFGGSILLNKIPITNYQLATLRSKIGIFIEQQDVFVGSLWENISLGRKEVSVQSIITMAENLGIAHFLETMPQGFETMIDPMGKKLPSTTVQKILLLRAFSNHPNLLLLEDPWLGFEDVTRQTMINYFLRTKENQTIIVASNDEEFAAKCDLHIQL
jgi:ATP-binding cassette, subfamily B, bacterial